MPIRPDSTVAEIALTYPAAPTLFEVVGIDYCCQASRLLRDAGAGAGMMVTDIAQFLENGAAPPPPSRSSVRTDAPLAELTKEIKNHYHRRARISLASMIWTGRALGSAHNERFPVIWDVRRKLEDLARELIPHMLREERYLFPYINGMDQGRVETETVVPLFGTVEYPLQQLRHDHQVVDPFWRRLLVGRRAYQQASTAAALPSPASRTPVWSTDRVPQVLSDEACDPFGTASMRKVVAVGSEAAKPTV